ncbi:hypothetical protein ACFSZS_25050 [Seohaeicola zhoushanensis]
MTAASNKLVTPTRRRVLGLAVLAGAVGLIGWRRLHPTYSGERLSVAEAHAAALAGEVTLVDIRRPDEWRLTGIGEGRSRSTCGALTSRQPLPNCLAGTGPPRWR